MSWPKLLVLVRHAESEGNVRTADERAQLDLATHSYKLTKRGERSFIIRNRICEGLGGLGITLDQEKNNRMVSVDALINSEHSPVKIAVITTDEPGQMAKETMELLHK